MLKYLVWFFCGAFTVTGLVIATGAQNGGLVALGFLGATLFYGLLARFIGADRLIRCLRWISGERKRSRRIPAMRAASRRSPVEQDVISALVHQGVSRSAAARATIGAALEAPAQFEPLFKTALGLLRSEPKRCV